MTSGYSVLMPLAPWEQPAMVAEALHSLCRQQVTPAKVVISCDGPPPAALRRVLEQIPLTTRIVCGPGGEGVGPVLARGMAACETELVVRADADDISLPQRCAVQISILLAQPHLAATSSPVAEFQSDPSHPEVLRPVPLSPQSIRSQSRWRNPLNHPAVLLRRSAVMAVGNYRNCPAFEDYDLWLRLLRAGYTLHNHNEPLVLCRTGPNHLARRRGWRYASQEAAFFWRCGRESLLPWTWIMTNLATRLPLRVLPARLLQLVMSRWLRRTTLKDVGVE